MRSRLWLVPVVSLALFVACASPPLRVQTPQTTSPVSEGARTTDQVILVTDSSGTMVASDHFPDAKALTQSMVAALPDGQAASARPKPYEAGLLGFGGTERITSPLGPVDRGALGSTAASLVPLGSIDGRGGETPYRNVLPELGAALQGKTGRAAVVIVSDGFPDQPERALAAAEAVVAAHTGELCIHTVQMGDDPAGAAFLNQLAALTPCGSASSAAALGSGPAIEGFVRGVMMGDALPTPVGSCDTVLRLRGVEFAFDRSDISSDSAVVLDLAAEQLVACPDVRVDVEGHTDFIGTEVYNQGLSERRAAAVKQYLVGKGVAAGRMQTVGYGESRPIAQGRSDEDRARNRRVEIVPR